MRRATLACRGTTRRISNAVAVNLFRIPGTKSARRRPPRAPNRNHPALGIVTLKLFVCQVCANPLCFENRSCERCGHQLAFVPEEQVISALEPEAGGFRALAEGNGHRSLWANAGFDPRNWLADAGATAPSRRACPANRTVRKPAPARR